MLTKEARALERHIPSITEQKQNSAMVTKNREQYEIEIAV